MIYAKPHYSSKSYWCSECVNYIQPQDAKKVIDFEIPTTMQDIEPAAYSIPTPGSDTDDISVKKKVEYKGGFKVLSQKGTIRFTDYREG